MRSSARTAVVEDLGCKVNHAEMDGLARRLGAGGVRVVDGSRADLVVINTCTVTAVADQKSRQAVRRARRTNPDAEIVVTGCSVAINPAPFRAETDDGRTHLVDARSERALDAALERTLRSDEGRGDGAADGADEGAGEAVDRRELPTLSGVVPGIDPGEASATSAPRTERTRAYVKVQDGCSFHCTYCVIPRARGPERSLLPEDVLEDVRRALGRGQREIVLTGINIGTYDGGASTPGPRGSHAWAALSLAGLIRRILAETPVERLRLSSIEPQHVTDELLDVWAGSGGRCLPHFHVPLQAGDDGVLRRMGRRYDSAFYAQLVARIRRTVPEAAIHADVIVGFPTEDEAAWQRGRAFIEAIGFAGLHVFRYSARPDTPAVRMAGQVDEGVRRERAADLLDLAAALRTRFAAAQVGRDLRVLFEEQVADGNWVGHAENHVLVEVAPADHGGLGNEIGVVRIEAPGDDRGRVVGRLVALERNGSLREALHAV